MTLLQLRASPPPPPPAPPSPSPPREAAHQPARSAASLETLEQERKALFNGVADAVVFVSCGKISFGSGFIVDKSGLVVTNRHVVDCKEKVSVVLRGGARREATVATLDPVYDLALLQVELSDIAVTPLTLADSDGVEVGGLRRGDRSSRGRGVDVERGHHQQPVSRGE
ncbi:MAG: trypsin-like peptidase domain-containing protein [Myxococcota bacterium]